MDITTIVFVGIGLSMDAFAVSIANSLCYRDMKKLYMVFMSVVFGLFQGIMPIIGYYVGNLFKKQISDIDHWVALILLCAIGFNMIKEAYQDMFDKDGIVCPMKPLSLKLLMVQAIATSIDALAIGVSFSVLKVNIMTCSLIITSITFITCFIGSLLGNKASALFKNKAEIFGGLILIVIGVKIFVEHMFF